MSWTHSAALKEWSLTSPSLYTPVSILLFKTPFSKSIFCVFSLLLCLCIDFNLLNLASSFSLNCSDSSEGHRDLCDAQSESSFPSFYSLLGADMNTASCFLLETSLPLGFPDTITQSVPSLSALLPLLVPSFDCTVESPLRSFSQPTLSLPSQDSHLIKCLGYVLVTQIFKWFLYMNGGKPLA